jgi:hypothetical protein
MTAKRSQRPQLFVACLAIVMLGAAQSACAQLDLSWHTIDGGGQTFSTGGGFSLGGTVGQPDAGVMTGGDYDLCGGFWFSPDAPSAVHDPLVEQTPPSLRVTAGGPNPFHDASHLRLELPEGTFVRARVFDAAGSLVRSIQDGWMPAGQHTLTWKGERDSGQRAPVGVYLIRLQAGAHESHHQVLLLQ